MGIKEIVYRMSEKKRIKKEQIKAMADQLKMQKLVEDRMKNSDERELERFYEEERQKSMKQNLEEFRKQRTKEFWETNMFLNNKNIFEGHKSILTDNPKLSIMGHRKVSRKKSKIKRKGGNMFFKH